MTSITKETLLALVKYRFSRAIEDFGIVLVVCVVGVAVLIPQHVAVFKVTVKVTDQEQKKQETQTVIVEEKTWKTMDS